MFWQISELAKQYWYIVVGGIGILIVLGAIFQWKWVLQSEGENSLGFLCWIRNKFGYCGYRLAIGAAGVLILAFALVYPFLIAAS